MISTERAVSQMYSIEIERDQDNLLFQILSRDKKYMVSMALYLCHKEIYLTRNINLQTAANVTIRALKWEQTTLKARKIGRQVWDYRTLSWRLLDLQKID